MQRVILDVLSVAALDTFTLSLPAGTSSESTRRALRSLRRAGRVTWLGFAGRGGESGVYRKTRHCTTCDRHRFPLSIIQHALWLYHRFPLSERDVQELLHQRGIEVSHETLRQWNIKFAPLLT